MSKLNIRQIIVLAALPLLLLLPVGCAKAPTGAMGSTSPSSGPQIFVTMTVAGTINPSLYYFVLFNVNGHGSVGPVPVIGPPYGNGFAAGAFTNYVEYNRGQAAGTDFGFYVQPASLQSAATPLGPGTLVNFQATSNTITFQFPFSALTTSGIPLNQIQDIQVNFVATNLLPLQTDTLANKVYGTLQFAGQSGNNFLNIPLASTGTVQTYNYQNTTSNVVYQYNGSGSQPVTSVPDAATDADLTVTNFSIQITSG